MDDGSSSAYIIEGGTLQDYVAKLPVPVRMVYLKRAMFLSGLRT